MSAAVVEETAAERRRRRILEKGQERMDKVMGTYSKDTGPAREHSSVTSSAAVAEPADIDPTCAVAGEGTAAAPDSTASPSTIPEASSLRQRTAAGTSSTKSTTTVPSASKSARATSAAAPDTDAELTAALLRGAPDAVVSFSSAVIAASHQTKPLRFAMAVAVAILAVLEFIPVAQFSPILQLVASNAAITLSVAFMLMKQPARFRLVDFQVQLRSGGILAQAISLVGKVLGKPLTTGGQALAALAWGAYSDSGCYLVAVVVAFLAVRGDLPVFKDMAALGGLSKAGQDSGVMDDLLKPVAGSEPADMASDDGAPVSGEL